MLVNCRSCGTLFQVSAGAKSIRCFLCQAITKIGDPRAHELNEAKQRQLKAILDQLTPQNFGKLFEQVKQVNIDSAVTLSGFVSQMLDKALMEPTSCEMYASFCFHLAVELPDFSVDNEKKITFKRILLNLCQEEFEREQAEAKRIQARRRMLGNIKLIGELYKKKMLPNKIMHKCIKKLLGQNQTPDEEDIESLCELMSTIGVMIDHPEAKEHMDAYFDIMTIFSNNMKLSSRVRFMLKDSIDLRNNKWQQGNMDLRASDRSLDRCMPSSSAPVQATSATVSTHRLSTSTSSSSGESASVFRVPSEKETFPRTQSFEYRRKKTGRKHAMCMLNQAQHDSFRAPPTIPPPSASKQQLPLKDSGTNKPLATEEPHTASSHAKRDVHPQVPSAAGTTITQKPSVHPIPGISMPMPFQSQVPIPFGGLNSQIQSQGVPTISLQMPMPMPLSVGSGTHVQQQVFVQGLQSHPIQPQGMMPQGQNLSFTTQIGHQLPPQMANMGIGISPQYSQQPRKFVSHRKAVKITHPDTHEELRLDRRTDSYKDSGSSGVRSHPNVPHQTQPMPPFTPHQISYYPPMQPGSYNHSMYFPTTQTAVPLTSTQMSAGPQGPRYTYPGQAPTTISFKNPSTLNPLPGGKNSEHPHDSQVATGSVSLPSVQVTVSSAVVSMGEGVGISSVTVSSPVVSKGESPKLLTAKGKKKKKDILKAADAADSTSERSCRKISAKGKKKRKDILKQENVVPGESFESSCSIVLREAQAQAPAVEAEKDIITAKEDGQIKGEPDDWEDAAELSTPKLKTFVGKQGRAGSAGNNEDGNISKKYSRDFLLTLSEQCTDLPTGFEIRKDIAESLMSVQVGISHLIANEPDEAKQRQLKAILNKLRPRNFEKALMEPRFCAMFANICSHFAAELPDFSEDNEKITFKRLLLNKCQEEFEREQPEANRVEEERQDKRIQARRRMLGNIRLIGELYKKNMLTERIMHEWIKRLLGKNQTPDEEDIESLCTLMSTIGVMIDHPEAKEHMNTYFDIMTKFSNNMKLSSRVRFMLKDSIDLRKNKWQQRRKVEGPKKIDEVHRDAAQERQAQATRLARGPSMSSSSRRGQPMDFSPRGSSVLPSPNSQIGGLRGYPSQVRGYGQDVRTEERHPYESRTLSVPLSQRPLDDNSITLGPQGGLARGMSVRGHPLMSGVPLVDIPPGDPRRFAAGPNGHSSPSEWTPYPREEVAPRYSAERSTAMPAYDQSNFQERNTYHGNRDLRASDRSLDRSMASSSAPVQATSIAHPQTAPEKVLPEEQLRDMSISAIREFYSAKDKDELALCIKELNAPSFYPSMVSIWVTDSFERKDLERDLLARLLVDLTKPRDSLLNQVHLVKGFESVLGTLEDAVNDAPKAAEFLGRILARVIMENVVPLKDIGHLIHEGGEEPGRLLQIGLAAEVLGSVLEIIKFEKGESVFNEIRTSSSLRLEDFLPPDPHKMRKLEAFF